MEQIAIIEITGAFDTSIVEELLSASIKEGFRHITRFIDEYNQGINRFDQPGEALFLAVLQSRVIGICGLNQYIDEKTGRVRRLYVLPAFRSRHIGRKLTDAVIHTASHYYDQLVLRTDNPQAALFYQRLGFVEVHEDPHVTHRLELPRMNAPVNTKKQTPKGLPIQLLIKPLRLIPLALSAANAVHDHRIERFEGDD